MPGRRGWRDEDHNAGPGRNDEKAGRHVEERGEEAYRSERGASGDASYGHRGNYEQVLMRQDEHGRSPKEEYNRSDERIRADERIREDLCARISECTELDASDVEVKVQDGEVILSGTVPERRFKHRIEEIAGRISGVIDVRNEIRLQHA